MQITTSTHFLAHDGGVLYREKKLFSERIQLFLLSNVLKILGFLPC